MTDADRQWNYVPSRIEPLQTVVYHTRSKGALSSLSSEKHKGKMRMTNDKIMDQTIEKEYPPSKLISCLEKKIRELEDDVSDMREWAKLLLSVNPTLETNMDRQPVTSQAIFQNNPPPAHPTSNPQNQSSSIHMPPTHFPNYLYPTLQAPLYETPLHQVSWYRTPLMPFQTPLIKCLHVKTLVFHINNQHISSTNLIFAKTCSMLRRSSSKFTLLY
ncbi:hypothetical protein KY289_008385 [Solanum tuberosum]|nr:hypothetical protein KY289_008385 [Solanum tuberosum]